MGVQGLWTVLQPCARPTNLATLNRKRLAVDASIWIYQFLKAVRDKEGNALRNSHVVGFFRRLCKLLWYGVKPVFVFDGGAPALKRATIQGRKRRREGRRDDAARTAGKLLAVQMHRLAEEEEEKRQRKAAAGAARDDDEEQEELPSMDKIVYAEELGMSQQERLKNRRFHKQDAYHLPELQNGIEAMGKPDDPRIMSVDQLEEYARQFNNGEDINLYDFSKIDFRGDFFKSLPPADRYNILNAARLRSRLRMGLSKDQLDGMFPDRMAFSKFQIERVKERNNLTQLLMHELGMGSDLTIGSNRLAGDSNREYILVKNEGAEGGWALGVVSKDKDQGKIHRPIDLDALDFQYQGMEDEEDEFEDVDFEDVPIEGLNRLPKLGSQNRRADGADSDDEAMFVDNGNLGSQFDDGADLQADEDQDLSLAIALSLQQDHEKDDDAEFENVPAPEWTQKAAEASKPLPNTTSGSAIAHIVNKRANATVPKRGVDQLSDSDSEADLQLALAAARKKQIKPRRVPRAPRNSTIKNPNPFGGPLPFEKLDWRSAFASTKSPATTAKSELPKLVETGDLEAVSDDDAGGFEKEPTEVDATTKDKNDVKPRPLPPWLTDNSDIRESVKKQQEMFMQMNAEDEELVQEEEGRLRRKRAAEIVQIESSSDDGSDIEVLDAPPTVVQQLLARKNSPSPKELGASLPSLRDDKAKEVTVVMAGGSKLAAASPAASGAVFDSSKEAETLHDFDIAPSEPLHVSPVADEEEEDEDMEFEDVTLPTEPLPSESNFLDQFEGGAIDEELFGNDLPPAEQQIRTEGLPAADDEPVFDEGPQDMQTEGLHAADEGPVFRDDSPDYDEFSDPEEEELLAQMAEEAEEHARFASELNSKSLRQNQEDYEKELRALRTQQKKDKRDADEVTQIMITECQALLRLFGIPYITAPMEAEAQCAELVRLGLVDGIVTDDSDTFLFGGTRVYKNMFNSNKFVECYLLRDLEEELSLSREQLIAIAQLLGSDYTEGIPGIGPVTAMEILSEFPGKEGLWQFKSWWDDVQSGTRPKEADADSPFRRKFRRMQATKLFLPPGFPSPAVFDAYMEPEVDKSPEHFQWGVPDLEGLRQFLMTTIGWGKERTDEVLVPVIRDMNTRDLEGTQANITRYFEGAVGTGAKEAFAPRQKATGSKRMAEAVGRLKAKKKSGRGGMSMEMPVAMPKERVTKSRKRKAREVMVPEEDGDEGDNRDNEAEGAETMAGDEDEDDDEDEVVGRGQKGKASAAGGGRGRGKRPKASE
ncbi:hypothetical protein QBC35DRAFT_447176 [Podospora australis]|uniref:DNA-repair protein rad13 n=1 Tax=Podospora australis TaxID=1536484 RepID=A0AAN6X7L7_9PEZI|nr:hypothetical protein QBC35DRAFT_447176 [Podospora australis]